MIKTLSVKNFKSLKDVELDCARINVLIGQPNSGKSNLLEALGMVSFAGYPFSNNPNTFRDVRDFVRVERTSNMFYDENLDQPLEIRCDSVELTLEFHNARFQGQCKNPSGPVVAFQGDHNSLINTGALSEAAAFAAFKSYRFQPRTEFKRLESQFLMPPDGDNLVSLLLSNRDLRGAVSDLFVPFGLKLGIRPQENRLEVIKSVDDVIIAYPYSLLSDTLQRVIFYLCAVTRNKESVITFEEPEAHAFPYYTKYLAELIALDDRENQYFIATHNPYFLMPLLEKTPAQELAVFIVHYQDYETRLKRIPQEQLPELFELDVSSNLDRFLEAE